MLNTSPAFSRKFFYKVVLLAIVIVLNSCSTGNSEKKSTDSDDKIKEELIALEKQSWEGWKNNDSKFYDQFLSDDHIEIGYSGLTDKASVVKFVGSKECNVKNFSVDQFHFIRLDENTAALAYHAAQQTTCGTDTVHSPVWVSSIYVKRDNHWLNAIYQQSMRPDK